MIKNFCKKVINEGGTLTPLLIPSSNTGGTGLCNPSIYNDNGKLILNLRHVNYTLYHCEGEQLFNSRYGPLSYLNPENDIHLKTWNYHCNITNDLYIDTCSKVDTSKLDIPAVWEFWGLEDARLVRWDDKLYMCGCRRDVKPNGESRMELSEIETEVTKNSLGIEVTSVKEINRYRIQPPKDLNSYCEKNWMPVLDMPFHFVKWTNPTEVVKVDIKTLTSTTVYQGDKPILNVPDFRGSSQVICWGDYRICLVHEVNLFKNIQDQKDATYTHRFIIWDKNWNIVHTTDSFSFMTGEIEFCCGMGIWEGDIIISFGFQDNAAFLLKIPKAIIPSVLGVDEEYLNWGIVNERYKKIFRKECLENHTYEQFFGVEEGDIVVDAGANIGAFTKSIIKKNPKIVYCIEPDTRMFETLKENLTGYNVTLINKGLAEQNGESNFTSFYNEVGNKVPTTGVLAEGVTFKSVLEENNITHIDFLKIDIEGAEYDVFSKDNKDWILNNIDKIAGEWHLNVKPLNDKFREFRDTYLLDHPNYRVFSMDGVDIKWDLWNEHFLDYYKTILIYIDNRKPIHSLEITTTVLPKGCVMKCTCCPQNVLGGAYKGIPKMKLDDFKLAIDKLPKSVDIVFSGFAEPFLNKDCGKMIQHASETGHKVSLFTTAIGMQLKDVEILKTVNFAEGENSGLVLHLPDKDNISKHPVTEEYLPVLEAIKESFEGKSYFYTMSLGELKEEYKGLFPNNHIPTLWSRAGNLEMEKAFKPELKNLKYNSSVLKVGDTTCSVKGGVNRNVMLPNGDVVLCCMDYSLKHTLGNLYTQSYDEIRPKQDTPFELCKLCENGKSISNV
jgi:FkbM family methyltransferase